MVQVAAERPSEGVVAEVHPEAVADLVDHRTVQAVTPFGVCTAGGLVYIVAPDQQVVRDRPCGIVRPDPRDYLRTLFQPGPEDPLAVRMEGDGPPLPLPTAFAADRDGALAGVVAEVNVAYAELDDLGDAEPHAELQMDDDVLQRGLGGLHESDAFLVGEPIHVRAVVVPEVDLHVLYDGVVVELQVPVQDVEVPVAGGDRLIAPVLQEEPYVVLPDPAGVQFESVVPEDAVDVDQHRLVLGAGGLLGVPVRHAYVLVDAGCRGVGSVGHGITRIPPRRSTWPPGL